MDDGKWTLKVLTTIDNYGGNDPNQDIDQDGNAYGNEDGDQQQDDVDQYFDDGGETFLPADHVCNCFQNDPGFYRSWWSHFKMPWPNNSQMNMNV